MKGTPCNETSFRAYADDTVFHYEFLDGDGEIPSSATIRLGDTDPMTGVRIEDVTFFRADHTLARQQIRSSLKAACPPRTDKEEEKRKAEREDIRREFEQEYGYTPTKDTIRYIQEQRTPERATIHLESFRNEEGESTLEYTAVLADPRAEAAFCGNEDPYEQALLDVGMGLEGRIKDVHEMILGVFYGGMRTVTAADIAEKWHVHKSQITRDRQKIAGMVMERIRELTED